MERKYQYGVIKKLNDATCTIDIQGKDYIMQRGPIMLPPTIKIGDNVKAIVVKGEIRHVDFDKNKPPTNTQQPLPPKRLAIKKPIKLEFACYSSYQDDTHKQKIFMLK